MSDAHDPEALLHHVIQAGDHRLVQLITGVLFGESAEDSVVARRAYQTLILTLGLAAGPDDYYRA